MRNKHLIPVGLLAAAVGLAACESDGSKKHASRATTRSAPKPAATTDTQTTFPEERTSSKVQTFAPAELAAVREKALNLLANTAQAGQPEERANALEALTLAPARLATIVESSLQDQNTAVRAVAAMSVGKAKLNNLAPRIRPLLHDESPFVRAAAMFALKRCGASVDISPLGNMLFDPSPQLRAHAAFILGELGDKSALGMLREAHGDQTKGNSAEQRISDLQIAEARVKLGDEVARSDIRAALYPAKPEDLEATVLAIQIAGEVHDTASINRLIELTSNAKDPSGQELPGEIRMTAATALAKLGQPHGSYIAREYFQGGKETQRALAATLMGQTQRPENLQMVSRLMGDPDGRVRVSAAAAVVRITDKG